MKVASIVDVVYGFEDAIYRFFVSKFKV